MRKSFNKLLFIFKGETLPSAHRPPMIFKDIGKIYINYMNL